MGTHEAGSESSFLLVVFEAEKYISVLYEVMLSAVFCCSSLKRLIHISGVLASYGIFSPGLAPLFALTAI